MAASEPVRSAAAAPGISSGNAAYFKSGTIERIFDDCGEIDGRRLPFQSKALAAFFVGRAQKQRNYSFVLSEASICETLGMDGKTFRKYLAPLVERGLVTIDKNRPDATRCFYCKTLFERYGDDRRVPAASSTVARIGKVSQTERIGKVSRTENPLREAAPPDRESFLVGSGNEGTPDRESIPNPSNLVTSSPHSLMERWGLSTTKGIEDELVFIGEAFATFGLTERRQRALVQRYGVCSVAGAVAYVKEQQRIAEVKTAGALLQWALQNGRSGEPEAWFGKVSRAGDDVAQTGDVAASPSAGSVHVVGDLWSAALSWLETRMSAAEFNMLVKPSTPLGFDNGTLRLGVQNAWLRDRVRERCAVRIVEALEALIGPSVQVEVETMEG